MDKALPLLALLACPLSMLAMGGIAWVAGKARSDRRDSSTDSGS